MKSDLEKKQEEELQRKKELEKKKEKETEKDKEPLCPKCGKPGFHVHRP